MSIILLNFPKGMFLPVGIQILRHPVHDPLSRFGIGEYAHGSGLSPDFSQSPFQDVGGPNGPPELLREAIVVKTMEQVLLRQRTAASASSSR